MIVSAMHGTVVSRLASEHDFQQPSIILAIMARFLPTSPALIVESVGMMPGFLTIYIFALMKNINWITNDLPPCGMMDPHH
jgi:hypothetical protein